MTPAGPMFPPPGPGVAPPVPRSVPPPPANPDVPPPPAGPGVAPPFAAPPVDRSRRSVWIGLTVGGVAILLCCAGGLFGFGLLVVAGNDQVQKQARQTVQAFLEAVRDDDTEQARQQLCTDLADNVSSERIASDFVPEPIQSFAIGTVRVGSQTVTVDAQVRYSGQSPRTFVFTLVSQQTELKICGWR
jgi:hypothetical protein